MESVEQPSAEIAGVVGVAELVAALHEVTVLLGQWLQRAPQDPDALLTTEQAAQLLQVPCRSLQDRAAADSVPHHRFGKHYRFSRSDIAAIHELTQRAKNSDKKRPQPR
ncbi:helix-turn-helix domain-containing protein [Umezawaea beigongshangensis]|uniref:helix-turn-helix domain-containing protein n=1 Tax=Umezawaea beigongshangensis TaxID=2780383 RepID=UPI0018F16D60|nr:helix-turn-helix domain-containing protein [Umezawaea beigongshangensis]